MTSAVVLGMIVTMFPQPRDQAKAIGVFAFVASAGGAVGLLAGGILTQAINWHWIFFVNLPIGVATAVWPCALLDHDRGVGLGRRAPTSPGAVLITGALMLRRLHDRRAGGGGRLGRRRARWRSARCRSCCSPRSWPARRRRARPLVPLRIFRSRNVAGANLIQVLSVAGMFGMFFLGALYLERVLRYDALEIGLAFLPATVVMGTLSVRYTERLIMRFGARAVRCSRASR